jgi:hypothetical protein
MASRFLEEGEDVLKKVGAGMGMTGAMITDKVGDLVNYFTGIKSPSAVETMNPVMEKIWGKKSNAPATPNTGQPFTGSTRYGVNSQGYAVEGSKQPGAPTGKEVEKFNYGIHNYKKNPVTANNKIANRSVSPTVPAKENVSGGGNGLWTPVYDKELETRNRESQISAASDEAYANLRYASSHGASPEELAALTSAYQGSFKPATNVQEAAYKEGEVPYAGEVLKSGIGLNAARAEEARASARLHQANVGKVGAETRNIGLSNKESKQRADEIKSLSVHTITDELGQTKTVYDTGYGMEQYNKLHGIPAPEPKTDADILAEARVKAIRNPSQRPRIRQYLINNGFDPKAIDEILGK